MNYADLVHLSNSNITSNGKQDTQKTDEEYYAMAASGTTINAQTPVIPNTKCQLCDENEIRWKCFNCEEFMCNQCKKVHLKSKATCNHKMTTMYESDDGQEQEGKNPDLTHTSCSYHPNEYVTLFCQECEEFLCKDCIANSSHSIHNIIKIDAIITEKSQELFKIMSDLSKKISSLRTTSEAVKKMSVEYSNESENCIEAVKSRNVLLKSKIDELTDDAIEKLQTNQTKFQDKFNEKEEEIAHAIAELTNLFDNCQAKQTKREIGLVQFIKDIKIKEQTNENITGTVPEDTKPPTFAISDVDDIDFRDIFGEIQLHEGANIGRDKCNTKEGEMLGKEEQ